MTRVLLLEMLLIKLFKKQFMGLMGATDAVIADDGRDDAPAA